jgi:hypothetical protein
VASLPLLSPRRWSDRSGGISIREAPFEYAQQSSWSSIPNQVKREAARNLEPEPDEDSGATSRTTRTEGTWGDGRRVAAQQRRSAARRASHRRHVSANATLASSSVAAKPCDGTAGATTAPVTVHIHGLSCGALVLRKMRPIARSLDITS